MKKSLSTFAVLLVAAPVFAEEKAQVPRIPGLGGFQRNVTTSSLDAQGYFNQGMVLLYAFNHDEAIRSFTEATKHDPKCAMAYWGISFASGPHINNPLMPPARSAAAWKALKSAEENAEACTPVEKALIAALAKRYADPPPEDRIPLDKAFADAMREVWKKFPTDADVGALFAESLMDLRPWDLWTEDGKPQPETPEVLKTLDAVLKANPNHPLGLHLYIHAVEAGPHPELADAAANRLRNVAPGLSHLVHMPSHVDVLRGRWNQAVASNQRAVEADLNYRKLSPNQDFFRFYMGHNRHMLVYAAMMSGRSKLALEHARAMLAEIPAEWVKDPINAMIVDYLHKAPLEVMMRFGMWDEILKEPDSPESFPMTRAMRHAIRGVAYAAKKQPAEARKEQAKLREIQAKIPAEYIAGNNKAVEILGVADAVLEGEILFREDKIDESLKQLERALELSRTVKYDEPPAIIIPIRHTLGATLLAAKKPVEAEKYYRQDLRRWPNNGWSLLGLAQSLRAQGKDEEAEKVMKRFETQWKFADVKPPSSCFCQQPGG